MTQHDWTPERVQKLKELCDAGLSARKIGLALGVSRNAALGKAARMGFKVHGGHGGGATHKSAKPRAVSPPKLSLIKATEAPAPVTFIGPLATSTGPGTCQYIDGHPNTSTWRMCGHPVARYGVSYCANHCAICFEPVRTDLSRKKAQKLESAMSAQSDAMMRRVGLG